MYVLIASLLLINPYQDLIKTESARYQLDHKLVNAVIAVESNHNTLAVGPRGSIGLMQIQPATGEWLSEVCGIPIHSTDQLFEPQTNIRIGTCYLDMLFKQFGSARLVLTAYNWGPARVEQVLQDRGHLPDEMLIYHSKVMRKYDRNLAD